MNNSENYKYVNKNLRNMFLIHDAENDLKDELINLQIEKLISEINDFRSMAM